MRVTILMRLASAGMTNKKIGKRLGITEQSVSTLIERIIDRSSAILAVFIRV
jgi:DNA-binding CsgD family transcriptional regulator